MKAAAISGVIAVAYWLVTLNDPAALNILIASVLSAVAVVLLLRHQRDRDRP